MKKNESLQTDKAMEGATIGAEGQRTDAVFHESAWNTTPAAAEADLKALAEAEEALMEAQVEKMAAIDRGMARRGYEHLLKKYPKSQRRTEWEKLIKDLA